MDMMTRGILKNNLLKVIVKLIETNCSVLKL